MFEILMNVAFEPPLLKSVKFFSLDLPVIRLPKLFVPFELIEMDAGVVAFAVRLLDIVFEDPLLKFIVKRELALPTVEALNVTNTVHEAPAFKVVEQFAPVPPGYPPENENPLPVKLMLIEV